jgi:4'-phosphopantetheinyl transferase
MKEARLKLTGEGISDNLKNVLDDTSQLKFTTVEQLDRNYIYTVCEPLNAQH